MTTDREFTIAGKKHTFQPFKLRQLRAITKLSAGSTERTTEEQADFGFTVLAMALENVEPKLEGNVEDAPFEPDELQDALEKVMGLAMMKTRSAGEGEVTAPVSGA